MVHFIVLLASHLEAAGCEHASADGDRLNTLMVLASQMRVVHLYWLDTKTLSHNVECPVRSREAIVLLLMPGS